VRLAKFERAAAKMMDRRASIEEKRAATTTFLRFFVIYLGLLACIGWGGSALLRSLGPTSTPGIVVALSCFMAGSRL
jgi:Na+/proline symporter